MPNIDRGGPDDMKKKCALLLLAAVLLGLLSGCFRSVDELYSLPKLPEEYQNLQAKIEEITGAGAEYSAPQRGENNQPVQLKDLDGDGVMEAIAFFRVSTASADEKPLKIYIFRLTDSGYEVGAAIEGDGSAIQSITYEDVNGGPAKELVVSWLSGRNATTLSVYSVERFEVTELMRSSYNSFKLQDLDMDNRKELVLVRMDPIEGRNRVEFWDSDGDSLLLRSSAMLSQGVTELVTDSLKVPFVQEGYLRGDTPVPALFVTSYQGEEILTDIFAWRDEALVNITMEENEPGSEIAGGVSYITRRDKDDAKITDINGDNVLEIPMPVDMASSDSVVTAEVLYEWVQFDLSGKGVKVFTTYHNFKDNWYFILPESWEGRVDVTQYASSGEEATVFSLTGAAGEEGESVLTIYKLTGPNRHMRARMGGRFTLDQDENTIYSAELTGTRDYGLDQADVLERFCQSKTDWSSGT